MNHKCTQCDCYECEPDEDQCSECLISNGQRKCQSCECWSDEINKTDDGRFCNDCLRELNDLNDTYRYLENER